jgi:hypothetical protein
VYIAQFQGAFADFELDKHWETKAEEKYKFFGWLISRNKLWTTDRIAKHGDKLTPFANTAMFNQKQRFT